MDYQLPMIAVLVVFNAATIYLLAYVLKRANISSAMKEKIAVDATGSPPPDSYSRIAGMMGAAVMVTLFWACSNLVIYQAFTGLNMVSQMIESIGAFLLYGSALFLPYAANQIRAIFPVHKP